MASIGKEKTATGTRYYIQLSPGENKSRPKIHLGRVTMKDAKGIKVHVGALLANRMSGLRNCA